MAAEDPRQQPNPLRPDGRWIRIAWQQGSQKCRGVIRLGKKHCTLPFRPSPGLAALDTDRVIYKGLGPDAETNGTLTPEVKAQLDGMTLEDVVQQIKATGGAAFSKGSSAYRGVTWNKNEQKWWCQFNKPGEGKRLVQKFPSELEAAHQYDAWCKQYGRPLSWYNFPPVEDQVAEGTTAGGAAAVAAAAAPALALAAPPQSLVSPAFQTSIKPSSIVSGSTAPGDEPPAATGLQTHVATATAAAASAAVPAQHASSTQGAAPADNPDAAAAGTATAAAAAAAAVGVTSSISPWEQCAEGGDAWWTDSSDWEDEDWMDQAEDSTTGQPGMATSTHIAAQPTAATAAVDAVSLHSTAALTAWQQVHGTAPLPTAPEGVLPVAAQSLAAGSNVQQQQQLGDKGASSMLAAGADGAVYMHLIGSSSGSKASNSSVTATARGTAAAAVDGCSGVEHAASGLNLQQLESGLPAAVQAAAAAASTCVSAVLQGATAGKGSVFTPAGASTDQGRFVFGSSGPSRTSSRHSQQLPSQRSPEGVAAAPAAPTSAAAAGAVQSSIAAIELTIETETIGSMTDNPVLTTAAIACAAAAITQHPRSISTADSAVAAAGGKEPPAATVSEIESALRTAAAQSVKQLQPGGSHYWRAKKAWAHFSKHPNSSSSIASTAAAAAEAAAKAADSDAAVAAAIAAAEAAGRGCRASDLHAAWLMQRLDAGVLRVTVRPPVLPMAAIELALADHGVGLIPGIDFEPVPGLHPELWYPQDNPTNPSISTDPPAPPADKAAAAAQPNNGPATPPADPTSGKDSTAAPDTTAHGATVCRDQTAAASSRQQSEEANSGKASSLVEGQKVSADAAGRDQAACSKHTAAPVDTSPSPPEDPAAAAPGTTPPAAAAPADSAHNQQKPEQTPALKRPVSTAATPETPAAAEQTAAIAAKVPAAAGGPMDWSAALAAAEAAAATSAAYPYLLPCDRKPFDAVSSEEDEPCEAEWVAGLIQGSNPAAAAAATVGGASRPHFVYGSNSAAGRSATPAAGVAGSGPAAAVAAGGWGGASAGGSIDGGVDWDPAQLRREHRERLGFNVKDIPTINMDWTGDDKADTIAFLQAVVAEGDADHLPSHIRAYRIAEMVKQKNPSFPLEQLTAMGRPIEGDYCPVVLGVPPPHPHAPAAAAAAAATAAASVRRPAASAKAENQFDPVNRRPAQALLLPGCSYTGLKAAARRATAAARAAMLPAEEPIAAIGLAAAAAGVGPEGVTESERDARLFAFETISMVGASQLVQQLRPVKLEDARAPGAAVDATAAAKSYQLQLQQLEAEGGQGVQDADQEGGDGLVCEAGGPGIKGADGSQGVQAGSKGGRKVLKAARRSSKVELPGAPAAAAAAAEQRPAQSAVAAAAAAAAARLRRLTACNEGPISIAPAAAAAAGAAAGPASTKPSSKTRSERIQFLQEMQRKARAALAAATSAPVVTAGIPDYAAAIGDDNLSDIHPSLLAAAAEAATEAAAAAMQPQPMEVDWTHEEDVVGEVGLWEPAEQRVNAAFMAALQAAKERAAALAAAGAGAREGAESGHVKGLPADMQIDGDSAGDHAQPADAAGAGKRDSIGSVAASGTGAGSSKGASSSAGRSSYLQKQVGLLMGFIKADSCPAISAAEEAALGIKMPRPLAIVHNYCSAAPAAGAAAAAVAALVPGRGRTYSSADEYPTAGSAGDVTRVSYGAAQKVQQGSVADLEARVQQLRKQQEYDEGVEAAFLSGGPEAAAAFMAAADAEADREDPNAWIDTWTSPTPDMVYTRAGGTGSWPEAGAALTEWNRDNPAVVAACELGLKIHIAASARLDRRLDAWEQQQQGGLGSASSGTAAGGLDAVLRADQQDLPEIIAAVLPRNLPLRAQQNALLAYRAASRMQAHLMGHDFAPDDVFDLYYEIKLPKDADAFFWGSVARGEIGRGQDGWALPQPRVRYYGNQGLWDSLEGQEDEKQRVLDAELRWEEECRIVQEARRLQLNDLTAPGAILHDIVLGAKIPVDNLDPFLIGVTARTVIKTTPAQRAEVFVQHLVDTGDTKHVPFWRQVIEDMNNREG